MEGIDYDYQKLYQLRLEKSGKEGRLITQDEVAQAVGTQRQTISLAENGEYISWPTLKKLARYYGVKRTSLLIEEDMAASVAA